MLDYANLFNQVKDIIKTGESENRHNLVVLDNIVDFLCKNVEKYKWIGYYFLAKSEKDGQYVLALGPFRGQKTDHVKIELGKGVCGQVALSKKTMIISDVSKLDNYLSCSIFVKSEIVVPVLDSQGNFLAEIDIDGHQLNAFDEKDKDFLEKIAVEIENLIPKF